MISQTFLNPLQIRVFEVLLYRVLIDLPPSILRSEIVTSKRQTTTGKQVTTETIHQLSTILRNLIWSDSSKADTPKGSSNYVTGLFQSSLRWQSVWELLVSVRRTNASSTARSPPSPTSTLALPSTPWSSSESSTPSSKSSSSRWLKPSPELFVNTFYTVSMWSFFVFLLSNVDIKFSSFIKKCDFFKVKGYKDKNTHYLFIN